MKLSSFLWISAVTANPLRLDFNLHLDLPDAFRDLSGLTLKKTSHVAVEGLAPTADELPIVELPYEKHQASPPLTADQKFYNFSNIPYAQQPIGDLRFKAAKALEKASGDLPLNNGQRTVICPQAQVGWVSYAQDFLQDFFLSTDKNLDKWKYPISPGQNYSWSDQIPSMPNMDESCLTLDVMVPKRIYDKRNDNDGWDAPVMVWFFGGGYVFGSKTYFGSPAGLFEAALQREDVQEEDIVFVAVNYRLGAFGWLAGDSFEKAGGFENAGLSDQLVALQWVKDNIRLFGGNPYEVTVVGESAGASSIMHHLTAYGGPRRGRNHAPPQFKRAILQSPALFPVVDRSRMETVYQNFLKEAGAKDFDALVKADAKDLIRANSKTTYESQYGQFNYGPVVDDTFVMAPIHLLLKYGFFWSMDIMVSYNRAEGMLFTPPWVRTKAALKSYITTAYPRFVKEWLDDAVDKHYIYDDSFTGKQAVNLTGQLMSDFGVGSNVYGLTRRFPYPHEYFFNFYPGIHGQDANYTFGPKNDKTVNKEQMQRFQRYLTSFIKWGSPNNAKLDADKEFEDFSLDGKRMTFGSAKIITPATDTYYDMEPDSLNKTRHEYWLNAPYWDPEEKGAFLRVQTHLDFGAASWEL